MRWNGHCLRFHLESLRRIEWHAGAARASTPALRFAGKSPLHRFHSLLHADQPQSATLLRCFAVKAHSGVPDRELKVRRSYSEIHLDCPCSAMLGGIMEGFLENSEQA